MTLLNKISDETPTKTTSTKTKPRQETYENTQSSGSELLNTVESQFQKISAGGAISYVEIPNMRHNLEALEELVKFIYDNIQYAEFNTKSDYCHVCGYDGEIIINDDLEWECPQCGNIDHAKMNVTRRTCGYLGENFWNVGKTKEIAARVLHI